MTRLLILSLLIMFSCTSKEHSHSAVDNDENTRIDSLGYNAELAKEVGADEYGMRQYVMAFLKAGPNRSQDSLEAANLQKAHMENITRLAEEGNLLLAGPFIDNGDIRGIYIFDVKTIEEARALTATDPAIQAGRLEMELHPWYGSAAVMKINEIHKQVAKSGI